jgi:retron-type reverse transcriptase
MHPRTHKEKETLIHFASVLNRLKEKQQNNSTILLFFDFRAAFDSVDFEILLNKSINYLSEHEVNAIKWYLSQVHRKIGNHLIPQNKGVPQGGILSPFLWLIFIDDLNAFLTLNHRQNNVFAYADDLLILVKSIPEAS